jgi:hypothetical protein
MGELPQQFGFTMALLGETEIIAVASNLQSTYLLKLERCAALGFSML